MKQKLLWIGDAGCQSGFALATHKVLDTLHSHYDVTVLGMNYRGDPHTYPYPIYAAAPGGDMFGIGRMIWMCDLVQPDVIVIQNDPWNIPLYINQIRQKQPNGEYSFPEHAAIPIVGIVPVDGRNCAGYGLNGLAHAIFWTKFAENEAKVGGYAGPSSVVPLGVDVDLYQPTDRTAARRARRIPEELIDAFIVGNVNRNQPRKRWDLMLRYFAKWINTYSIKDAYLYLHTAPTGDRGIDVVRLAQYYGINDRMLIIQPPPFSGVEEYELRDTYNSFDVQLTTTQGEGFGLTTFEGMACGVPQIVPDWSALGELCKQAAIVVPCTSTCIGAPYVNVIGGVADEQAVVNSLQALYESKDLRIKVGEDGLDRAHELRFRWGMVANGVSAAIQQALAPRPKLVMV
jgi:glycosyltransferase involved in cell wall biosynthesis